MMQAEQAAELLGLDLYDLGWQLRHWAADELSRVADRVRRDEDASINVARARRLKWAADACLAALDAVSEVQDVV